MAAPARARFQYRIWGARGSCPSPGPETLRYGGNTACVEVRSAAGDVIILDAGTGLRGLGKTLMREGAPRRSHIFLSHRHGDHVIGLPHFAPLYSAAHRISIHCGNSNEADLRDCTKTLLSPPFFPELDGLASAMIAGEFDTAGSMTINERTHVRRLDGNHPGGAAVLVVEDEEGPAIAYAPDNELAYLSEDSQISAWRSALAEKLRRIPVLVHDAMYLEEEMRAHAGWGHSSAEEATRFAMECEAALLVLFHHHPDRDDDAIDRIVERCRAIASGSSLRIEGAAEGFEGQI